MRKISAMRLKRTTAKVTAMMLLVVLLVGTGGCGSAKRESGKLDSSVQKQKEKSVSTDKSDKKEEKFTNTFTMDHEAPTGFMKKGEPQTEVPKGYVGIYSVDDMQKIKENDKGKYILMADIDMSQSAWDRKDFSGVLDGNYHVLSGLKNTLFEQFFGTVQNIGFENVDVSDCVLARYMNSGTVTNCYITGNIYGQAGFVCMLHPSNSGNIEFKYCYNAADITSDEKDFYQYAYIDINQTAGMIAYIELSDCGNGDLSISFYNCENYGKLHGVDTSGGIVGKIKKGDTGGYYTDEHMECNITACFNYGEITGDEAVGGIIGEFAYTVPGETLTSAFKLQRCANYKDVTGTSKVGGICGNISLRTNRDHNYALVVDIEDCLNTAAIKRIYEDENKTQQTAKAGGVYGHIDLNWGTCRVNRCLDIGDAISRNGSPNIYNPSNPVFECNDYYSTSNLSIAQMKDIKKNLPTFDYPYVWGIDELYDGFPHPYGEDEYDAVMAYAKAQNQELAEQMVEDMDASEIILRQRYADMLASINIGGYWPEDTEHKNYLSYLTQDNGNSYYALTDVDDDGREELLVKISDMGVIYKYDIKEDSFEKEEMEDGATSWEGSYNGKEEIEWLALKQENYGVYTDAYIGYYLEQMKKDLKQDIGAAFIETDRGMAEKTFIDILTSDFGIEFDEVEQDFYYEGSYEGKQVVSILEEDGGSVEYSGEQVNGLTMIGLYPGMSWQEAEKILQSYGFHERYSYTKSVTYCTGDSFGNYFVYIDIDNGAVTNIQIRGGSAYTG